MADAVDEPKQAGFLVAEVSERARAGVVVGALVTGWGMLGDGTEVWTFPNEDDDESFAKVYAYFAHSREQVPNSGAIQSDEPSS